MDKRKCLGCFNTYDEALEIRRKAEFKFFKPLIDEVAKNERP